MKLSMLGALWMIPVASLAGLAACGSGDPPGHAARPSKPAADTTVPFDTSSVDAMRSAPLYPATRSAGVPDFALPTLDGSTFRLKEYRGQVVVLNFWATWCPPCRAEIPGFIKLQNELGDQGVVFAGISLDEEGWEVVRPYVEEMQVNYPVMVDDGTTAEAYGPITVMPTTFIIDQQGELAYFVPGMVAEEELRPILLMMLEEG